MKDMKFNWRYKSYEIRSVNKHLLDEAPHERMELLKHGEESHFTLAHWVQSREGYYSLKFVNNRPFNFIDEGDIPIVWEMLRIAQEILDGVDDDE